MFLFTLQFRRDRNNKQKMIMHKVLKYEKTYSKSE